MVHLHALKWTSPYLQFCLALPVFFFLPLPATTIRDRLKQEGGSQDMLWDRTPPRLLPAALCGYMSWELELTLPSTKAYETMRRLGECLGADRTLRGISFSLPRNRKSHWYVEPPGRELVKRTWYLPSNLILTRENLHLCARLIIIILETTV